MFNVFQVKAPDTGPRDFESNRHGINPPLACLEMEVDDFTIGKLWETFGDKKEFDAKFYRMSMRDLPYNSAVRYFIDAQKQTRLFECKGGKQNLTIISTMK